MNSEHKNTQSEGSTEAQPFDLPLAYGLTCELPAAHGTPLEGLDRVWVDYFELDGRVWMFILNGDRQARHIESINLLLDAGTAFVVCENQLLSHLTPEGITWYFDADSGERLTDEECEQVGYWDAELIRTLHTRLTDKGRDLPPLEKLLGGPAEPDSAPGG